MAFSKFSDLVSAYPRANEKIEIVTSGGGSYLIQDASVQVEDCQSADAIKIKDVNGNDYIMGLCLDKIIAIRFLS